jgi:hypothetical protein
MTIHLQERLLKDVRGIGVARQPARQAEHAAFVPRHKRFKGMVVPGRRAGGEHLVRRIGWRHDHADEVYRV